MKYVLLPDNGLQIMLEDEDPFKAVVGPNGAYRVYHMHDGREHAVELFAIPNRTANTLIVKAMGYWPLPEWEGDLTVAPEHREALLPEPVGEEEILIAREVTGLEIPLTLRHVLRMHFSVAMLIARNVFNRANMSDRRRDMIGINNWLTEAYRRYQFANGIASQWRTPFPGPYSDPYQDNCRPIPAGWKQEIERVRHVLLEMFDRHEDRSSSRLPRAEDFWKTWHEQWDTDILVRIRELAGPYGWVQIHNPTSVEELPRH